MAMTQTKDGPTGPPTHRRRRVWRVVVAGVVLLLVAVGGGAYAVMRHLDGNIGERDITPDLGADRPPVIKKSGVKHQPLNIVVIGSDTRQGKGNRIGGESAGLSDTTILFHLSADRRRAYGVSIPRDSMVQRPECRRRDGGTAPAELSQFNDAYAIGGAGCTVKTIEQLTGIQTQHYLVVDFHGFKQMVDALGGVKVCIPEPVDDPGSDIHFKAGTYDISGAQALSYVRERHAVGDGSDIGRIKRQQAFIGSMSKKVISAGTLANPVKLVRFLNAATRSVQTDPGLAHVTKLVGLARQFENIGLDKIAFLTVPNEAYPPDPNRLQWQQPQARKLFHRLNEDLPLTSGQSANVTTAKDPTHVTAKNRSRAAAARAAETARANGLCA
jgi:LCP family protein required for cell wall assembly